MPKLRVFIAERSAKVYSPEQDKIEKVEGGPDVSQH